MNGFTKKLSEKAPFILNSRIGSEILKAANRKERVKVGSAFETQNLKTYATKIGPPASLVYGQLQNRNKL